MTVFNSDDMVARGNFISLMFFVMSLGILVVYFFMGWSTNTIAQVSVSMCLKNGMSLCSVSVGWQLNPIVSYRRL